MTKTIATTTATTTFGKLLAHDWQLDHLTMLGKLNFGEAETPQRVFDFAKLFAERQPFVPAGDRAKVIKGWTDLQTKLADSSQSVIAGQAIEQISSIVEAYKAQSRFDNGHGGENPTVEDVIAGAATRQGGETQPANGVRESGTKS
jgi:hypothetical protein